MRERWAQARAVIKQLDAVGLSPLAPVTSRQARRLVSRLSRQLAFVGNVRSAGEVSERQSALLHDLLEHAVRHVPFYRRAFGAKATLPLFSQLPFLFRRDLRERGEQLISDLVDGGTLDRKATSGTSGVPVHIFRSTDECFTTLHYDLARTISLTSIRSLPMWESPYIIAITDNPGNIPFAAFNPLVDKWCRFEIVDPAEAQSAVRILNLVEDLQPAAVVSRPSALSLLSRVAGDRSLEMLSKIGIVSSGANLYPDDRRRIELLLNGLVFDLYAISESDGVASQCVEGRYHVHWELSFVEIVDPATSRWVAGDEPGSIIVTSLMRRTMPIIRYVTGDVGRWAPSPCPCGRPGPTLAAIDGRESTYFRLADGRLFNPAQLNTPMSWIPGLEQYAIRQTAPDTVVADFVCSDDAVETVERKIVRIIHKTVPVPLHVTCRRLTCIGEPGKKVQRYQSGVERPTLDTTPASNGPG
jgi:phenylacetate-CoA ligase